MQNKDYVIRVTAGEGSVRGFFATTKNTANESFDRHKTSPVVSVAQARMLTATAIIGQTLKHDKDKVTVMMKGDGPMQGILATANGAGVVKGYPYVANVDVPLTQGGNLDVGSAIGFGELKIIKDIGLRDAYTGQIPLISGQIADDLTYYYAKSEQIPTSFALSASVDVDYTVKASGGFMIQMLPGADDSVIDKIEKKLQTMPKLTVMLEEGKTPEEIAEIILGDIGVTINDKCAISFECDCSKEKVEKALVAVGKTDLTDIYETDKKAQLHCHFCNTNYDFTEEDLKNILDRM